MLCGFLSETSGAERQGRGNSFQAPDFRLKARIQLGRVRENSKDGPDSSHEVGENGQKVAKNFLMLRKFQ